MSNRKWHLIEAAPKDGTRIRGKWIGATVVDGFYPVRERITWWGRISESNYGWCYGRNVDNPKSWEPSRWLPLDEQPKHH